MESPRSIIVLFLLLLLGVGTYLFLPQSINERRTASSVENALNPSAPPREEAPPLGRRTKATGCRSNGRFPDPACTPGEVFVGKSLTEICTPGYSKTVRHVTRALRKAVFAEYGLAYPPPRGAFEVDHYVPLALGGDNSIANLFPQAAAPAPGFHEKDIVEVYLQQQVCSGHADLVRAQRLIAWDWLLVYRTIPATEIKRIRSRYTSSFTNNPN